MRLPAASCGACVPDIIITDNKSAPQIPLGGKMELIG
jgi:hypothetical protein